MNGIISLRDIHDGAGAKLLVERVWHSRRRIFPLPEGVVLAPVAVARINEGRWIADCPFCAGAEMVDMDKRLFYCLSCYNVTAGHAWLRIEIPAEWEAIETVLLERPYAENRNWQRGETVADLKRENKERR